MPTRIMHVVDTLGKGGLENGLVNLIQHLDPARFEHIVYALRGLGPNADRLPLDRVRLMCLGKKDTDSRVQIPALVRAMREVKPDIVHSRNWGTVEAVMAGRWAGSCALIHGEHGLESDGSGGEPRRRIYFRRMAFELADQVLSVSHQLRDLHAQRTGFPSRRITVIHNGVDSQRFCPDAEARARVRQELGISEDGFCVGCVGNLLPIKDHLTLLKAVAGMAATARDWRLLIVGEGPERANLEAFAASHPDWREGVSFAGSSNRIPELLNAMDVYVLPSIMEGISNSLLEAMATGLPVTATATGGNPEVVADGESGLLFPVGDARQLTEQLLLLRARPEWRLQLGQKARLRVRQDFSIDAMAQKYEQVYERVRPSATVPTALAEV